MRRLLPLALLASLTVPAAADTGGVIDQHILPRIDRLASEAAILSDTAAKCDADATRAAWMRTFQAWSAVQHLSLGPGEDDGYWPAISYWPDDRDSTGRALTRLLAQPDLSPEAIARGSVAGRGLMALERLLWDLDAPCGVTYALADDLAATTGTVASAWRGFAELMRTPGADGNLRFLDQNEVTAALFTSLMSGLEHTAKARLARPLGTFDAPRPRLAEAYRSGQSRMALVTALTSLRELAAMLADAPRTDALLAKAVERARAIPSGDLSGVARPEDRVEIEAVFSLLNTIQRISAEELGEALQVPVGFNALDGD